MSMGKRLLYISPLYHKMVILLREIKVSRNKLENEKFYTNLRTSHYRTLYDKSDKQLNH